MKKYTKRQILEAISYWKTRLNEDFDQYNSNEPKWTTSFTNRGECDLYHCKDKNDIDRVSKEMNVDVDLENKVIDVVGAIYKLDENDRTTDMYRYDFYFTGRSDPSRAVNKVRLILLTYLKDYPEYNYDVVGYKFKEKSYDYDFYLKA